MIPTLHVDLSSILYKVHFRRKIISKKAKESITKLGKSFLHIIDPFVLPLDPEVCSGTSLFSLLPIIWFSFSQQSQLGSISALKDELLAH